MFILEKLEQKDLSVQSQKCGSILQLAELWFKKIKVRESQS